MLVKTARALDYPFDVPRGSFVVADGGVRELTSAPIQARDVVSYLRVKELLSAGAMARHTLHALRIEEPVGLLACGSNASATRLSEKLSAAPLGHALALRITLAGWTPVFAATLSYYGAIPATFEFCAGRKAEPFLIVIDRSDAETLIASESHTGNYDVRLMSPAAAKGAGLTVDFPIFAFVSRHGALVLDQVPIPVPDFQPAKAGHDAKSEPEVLTQVLARLGLDLSLESYLQTAATDAGFLPEVRREIIRRFSRPAHVPGMQLTDRFLRGT